MEAFEQANLIDILLKSIYNSTTATTLAMGIDQKPIWSAENKENYKNLEYLIEDLSLVQLVNGRNNFTIDGQCEYLITKKGRELVQKEMSSLALIENKPFADLFDPKGWDDYLESKVDKRIDQADYFIDIIISEQLIPLDKQTIKKYFKEWFLQTQEFDFEIKDNDLAFEDGDLKFVPDFDQKHIPEFIKWFNIKKKDFIQYMKNEGIVFPQKTDGNLEIIHNSGNMVFNKNSVVGESNIHTSKEKESAWTKANVIIAAIVGAATILGIIYAIVK